MFVYILKTTFCAEILNTIHVCISDILKTYKMCVQIQYFLYITYCVGKNSVKLSFQFEYTDFSHHIQHKLQHHWQCFEICERKSYGSSYGKNCFFIRAKVAKRKLAEIHIKKYR